VFKESITGRRGVRNKKRGKRTDANHRNSALTVKVDLAKKRADVGGQKDTRDPWGAMGERRQSLMATNETKITTILAESSRTEKFKGETRGEEKNQGVLESEGKILNRRA